MDIILHSRSNDNLGKIWKYIQCFLFIVISFLNGYAQSTSVFDASYFSNNGHEPSIKPGRGFHINDVFKQTKACFIPETCNGSKMVSQQSGGKKTSLRLYYTKNNKEFNDLKTHGTSGKISFLNLFSISESDIEKYSDKKYSEEERLIFTANVDFGLFMFETDPKLNPDAKSMIEQNKAKEFINLYGTHYISGIRKESSISVILTKGKYKNSHVEEISEVTKFGGKIPYRVSGSLEVNNGSWINETLDAYEFSVSVEINGPTIEQSTLQNNIKEIINGNEADKSTAIANIIENAIKNISDPNQSYITQYYYAPFTLYGIDGIYWDEKKQNQLTKINEVVFEIYSGKKRMNDLMSSTAKEELRSELVFISDKMDETQVMKIIDKYDEILPKLIIFNKQADEYLAILEEKYNACSDIYCPKDSACCKDVNYLLEIKNYNLNKQIENEWSKVISVIEEVVEEINMPECRKTGQGIITITNVSSHPYNIYQGSVFIAKIPGNTTTSYLASIALHNLKAVQTTGYMMYPTENIRSADITKVCEEINLRIGFED